MAQKIMPINKFANICGYFYNAYIEKDFSCNNGYNCSHPNQSETDTNEETGEEIGKCYCWSCPMGYEADREDFHNPDIKNDYTVDDFEEFKYF